MASDQVSIRLTPELQQILDVCALLNETNRTAYATQILHDHLRGVAKDDVDVGRVLEAKRNVAAKKKVPNLTTRRESRERGIEK